MSPPKQPQTQNFQIIFLIEGTSLGNRIFWGLPQLSISISWRVMVKSVGEDPWKILAPKFWLMRESKGVRSYMLKTCIIVYMMLSVVSFQKISTILM